MNEHPHEKQPSRDERYSGDPVEYLHSQVERLSAFELAPGIFIGQEFTVPDIEGVVSLEGGTKLPWVAIERGGTGHGPGKSGILKEGAQIKAMGLSKRYGVLCEYHPNTRAMGTEVSEGSLFFIPVAVLKGWPVKVERDVGENQRRSRIVDMLMTNYQEAVTEMGILAESRVPKTKNPEGESDDGRGSDSRSRNDRSQPPGSGYGGSRW